MFNINLKQLFDLKAILTGREYHSFDDEALLQKLAYNVCHDYHALEGTLTLKREVEERLLEEPHRHPLLETIGAVIAEIPFNRQNNPYSFKNAISGILKPIYEQNFKTPLQRQHGL